MPVCQLGTNDNRQVSPHIILPTIILLLQVKELNLPLVAVP